MTRRGGFLAIAWLSVFLLTASVAVQAQGIVLSGLQGGELREADLTRGSSILIIFASWSPRGQDVHARANRIASRWGSEARVAMINFQEDRSQVDSFLRGKNLQAPVYLDENGAFSKKYAVTTLPSLLVLQDGRVAFRGPLPENPDQVLGDVFR